MRTALKHSAIALFPPLRRLIDQRNNLAQRLDMAIAATVQEGVRHRQFTKLNADPIISSAEPAKDDQRIVERLIAAYQKASTNQYGKGSMWGEFFEKYQKPQHEVFMSGDIDLARAILSNPASNNLFYGFDELCSAFIAEWHADLQSVANACQDNLLRLAEAIGVVALQCPEMPMSGLLQKEIHTDSLLRSIEKEIGVDLTFPDIYSGATGMQSYRGIMTYRQVQSLHLAIKVRDLVDTKASICEIGGGLGRGALFAHQLGVKNYTLVDIPMTTISQGYYLMRTLGENAVVLPGEKRSSPEQVQLMHSEDFFASQDRYDLVVNVDSITELGDDLARKYAEKIAASTDQFLSINHECNNLSVNSMMREIGYQQKTRYPYWMRQGYVEELYRFS